MRETTRNIEANNETADEKLKKTLNTILGQGFEKQSQNIY